MPCRAVPCRAVPCCTAHHFLMFCHTSIHRISGVTDYYALDDVHALHLARRCVKNLNYKKTPSVSKVLCCTVMPSLLCFHLLSCKHLNNLRMHKIAETSVLAFWCAGYSRTCGRSTVPSRRSVRDCRG